MTSHDPAEPSTVPDPTPAPRADPAPELAALPAPSIAPGPSIEPGGRPSGPRSAVYAAVALIVVLAFGSGVGVGRVTAPAAIIVAPSAAPAAASETAGSPPASTAGSPAGSPAAPDPLAGLPTDGARLGSPSAKVELVYWADYQCPFCARFAQDTLPQLAARIADGTVAVVHRDFVFLGPESLEAAIAVRCAGEQGRYWPMHDAVYAAQNGENQGTFSSARLAQLAAGVGADPTAFGACTKRDDVMVDTLEDTAAAVRAGVSSTPTVHLPGRTFLGVPDITELLAAIDAAASGAATVTPAPSSAPSGDPWADTVTAGLTAGAGGAPVTVELWLDYQAAGMPAIASELEPKLRERVSAGTVRVVLRDLAVLGDESTLAAAFIRCAGDAGERAVWYAHDILASSARGAGSGIYTSRSLLWFAAKFGWHVASLDACMTDPATTAEVASETATGRGLGLSTAPAVIVTAGGREVARFTGSSIDAAKVIAAVEKAAR